MRLQEDLLYLVIGTSLSSFQVVKQAWKIGRVTLQEGVEYLKSLRVVPRPTQMVQRC